jgi:OOP family OmpA-OmpF porin
LEKKKLNKIKMKILYFLVSLVCFQTSFSQVGIKNNKLSLDYNLGSTNPISNLSPSYYANYLGLLHTDIGARYMLTNRFGFKADLGFDRFKNDEFKVYSNSLKFNSQLYRINIQAVSNIGKVLQFVDWTEKFGLIAHTGFGFSVLRGDTTINSTGKKTMDNAFNFVVGLSPQFKITDRIATNIDISFVSVINPRYNFDFKNSALSSYGTVANISAGVSYYFGKEKSHVDWYNYKEIIEIEDTIVKIDSNLIVKVNYDQDEDGILDSLDFCPDVFGIIEFDGCPKPELSFDCNLNHYPIFQFKGARSEIQESYIPYLDSIAKCMLANPDKKIMIYGFTDDFGDEIYTDGLSQSRANQIKAALVERGVAEDRILTIGEGRKKAKLSEENRKIIKHNRLAFIETISKNQDDIRVLASGEYLQGLFFTVQIGAYRRELKNNKFGKLGKVLVTKTDDGIHRYSINVYTDYDEADKKWRELRKFGFAQDAFVAAYFLGERITIQEARRLIAEKGNSILQK